MPMVTVQAGYMRPSSFASDIASRDGLVAKIDVTIPIFTGGAAQAEARAAAHSHMAAVHQVADTKSQTRAAAAQAWSQMMASKAALTSMRSQHAASRKALAGIDEERRLGQRTVIEQINAQQAVLSAETQLEQTKRNLYLATCTVLLLTGRLTPGLLDRPSPARTVWNASVVRTWQTGAAEKAGQARAAAQLTSGSGQSSPAPAASPDAR
jgi:outer membrane protein